MAKKSKISRHYWEPVSQTHFLHQWTRTEQKMNHTCIVPTVPLGPEPCCRRPPAARQTLRWAATSGPRRSRKSPSSQRQIPQNGSLFQKRNCFSRIPPSVWIFVCSSFFDGPSLSAKPKKWLGPFCHARYVFWRPKAKAITTIKQSKLFTATIIFLSKKDTLKTLKSQPKLFYKLEGVVLKPNFFRLASFRFDPASRHWSTMFK